MWIQDPHSLQVLTANDSALRMHGCRRAHLPSLTLDQLQTSPKTELLSRLRRGAAIDPEREWTFVRKDGTRIHVRLYVNDIVFRGRAAQFVAAEDVTERRLAHAELHRMAHHDALTGLPNRTLLQQRLQEALARATKQGHRAAILCLDLDRFKQVNDWYGHAAGDECLKQIGTLLTRRLRGMDTVARTGGEEFTLILGEVESVAAAGVVAKAVLQMCSAPIDVDGNTILISASCGVAVFPDHGSEGERLLRSADAAMYRAKRAGGNRFVMVSREVPRDVSELERTFIGKPSIENLQASGFHLHYQPQHRICGELRGVEALLRTPHHGLGFVGPERFIAIAEDNGLIHPVGQWVIQESCRQLALWNASRDKPISVAVNVSPIQLARPQFAQEVRRILDRSGIDPAWLEFELTERVVASADEIADSIGELAALGVRFAIDDFGTGYSSLLHLQRLPVSVLKIDRSFIHQLSESSRSYPIVRAMISMGHSLQMEIIAEGVETEAQRKTLEALQCDCIQGFLISRPAPPETIESNFL
jgi:diguanylate cyclase (GGDEF)-like protein/PAS domain S-box-containing protein